MILVLLSQLFGATMNVMTQYLEVDRPDGTGMDPFQVRAPLLLTTAAAADTMIPKRFSSPVCPSPS